jgi:hypothetical protein
MAMAGVRRDSGLILSTVALNTCQVDYNPQGEDARQRTPYGVMDEPTHQRSFLFLKGSSQ